MKVSVAIQVLPDVSSEDELIRIVDEVIAYIKSTGLNCYVGPFETTIEGESYDELMEIVANCQKIAIKAGCPSVSAYIKVVYNPEGEVLTIDKKGCFIDGLKISDVNIDQFKLTYKSVIRFKFQIMDDARNVGGLTLFGSGYGTYNQDIKVHITYSPM